MLKIIATKQDDVQSAAQHRERGPVLHHSETCYMPGIANGVGKMT